VRTLETAGLPLSVAGRSTPHVVLSDTGAALVSLFDAPSVSGFAALSIGSIVTTTDLTLSTAQASALFTYGYSLVAAPGHDVTYAFADGSKSSATYGAGGALTAARDWAADGSLIDIGLLGITGAAYTSYNTYYGANGKPTAALYSNGMNATWSYNADGSLHHIAYFAVTGQAYSSFEYDYSAGLLSGSRYFFTNVAGQAYTAYEVDLDTQGGVRRYLFTGVQGQAYSSYEYDFAAGALIGSKYFFTGVSGQAFTGYEVDLDVDGRLSRYVFTGVSGQPYSSYEYDYDAGVLVGSRYFFTGVTGRPYTGYEVDLDTQGRAERYLFTGVQGQAYSSYEYDLAAGALIGSKYFFTGVTGQAYTSYEVDLDAHGALTGSKYQFTGVSGQAYASYELDLDASGKLALKTLNNNDGSHRIQGFADHLTIDSILDDTITGGGASETFVFKPGFAQDVITDFAAHLAGAGHDTIQFAVSAFANAAAMFTHAADVGGNSVITAANGDRLTLPGTTVAQLKANPGDFQFA
jgi:hypothetical protein